MEPNIISITFLFHKTCNEISLTVHTRAPARAHSPPRKNLADAWANEIIQYKGNGRQPTFAVLQYSFQLNSGR